MWRGGGGAADLSVWHGMVSMLIAVRRDRAPPRCKVNCGSAMAQESLNTFKETFRLVSRLVSQQLACSLFNIFPHSAA